MVSSYPCLCLFCPAIGCQHLYSPIRDNMGGQRLIASHSVTCHLGLCVVSKSNQYLAQQKTKPQHIMQAQGMKDYLTHITTNSCCAIPIATFNPRKEWSRFPKPTPCLAICSKPITLLQMYKINTLSLPVNQEL